ncbi:hypothetical protein BDF20DRAFT_831695 [Mycotypha africana]|uniref:uncharacterized protein n=1 Tax=Mycotypha africana TaxID=64632 RepID=UPI0022FFDAB8|nr:uncharacterized protein BDF20DRAFT_831695 [Mycotypha africana]KAI8991679.1 hypothetical protein BDF20DRAFT_831695 [Mycotypha africana]
MALKRSDRRKEEKDPFIDDAAEEDDEEDEEEDEDYDDDDDDDVRPRKRKAFNPFIDEMAVVDDDEDEEEEEEEYGKEDGFIEEGDEDLTPAKTTTRRHQEVDRQRREMENMNEEQIAAFYSQKYGNRRRGQLYTQTEDVPQQLLYPSVNDPNLWMVKCKPGKERDIIFGLMKRYFDRLHGPNPLDTFSAFARETLKGYIYIEAKKQAHVQEALLNIPNIYMTTLMLVPISDMIGAITVQKKESPVDVGAWVRIKRGTYAGDLGQVVEVNEAQDSTVVKVVPRLDLENKNHQQDEFNANGKRGKNNKIRPPPRFFVPEKLANRAYSSLQKKGSYWVYNGDSYRDGYLEKSMKMATLQIEGVNPSLEEIAKFAGNNELTSEDGERALDLASLSNLAINNTKEEATLFQPGDAVTVVEGDMIHATGIVDNVKDTSVTVSLKIDGSDKKVTLPARQLRKTFKEGDHVKVINGRFKDESGLVLKVDGNIVTLLSDASLKEVKVFSKDLREAVEVMFGKTVIGNYELHDLVQLDFHTVGVIVKVNRDSFQVLTQNGEMRTVEPHQITNKRDSTRAVATDANGNSIRDGDTVTEVPGGRRNCSILHLYRQLVFLHSREHTDNYGVWVTNTRSIVSAAPKAHFLSNTTTQNPNMQAPRNDFNGRGGFDARGGRGGRGGMRGGFMGRGRGGRDNLVAKTVRISQGPHKGYIGIVKDTTDTHARVELHTNSKVLSIDKSHLTILDAQGNPIGQAASGTFAEPFPVNNNNNGAFARPMGTPSRFNDSGAKTPAWSSSRTPNPYAADGGRTPAWNSGSKTPAWSSSARTPNPYARNNDGGRTPAWDSGSKTPAHGRHKEPTSSTSTATWSASANPFGYTNLSGALTPGFYGDDINKPDPRFDNIPLTAPTPKSSWNTAPTPAASNVPFDIRAPTPAASGIEQHTVPRTPYSNLDIPSTPYASAPTPGGNLGIPATPAALSAPTPGANLIPATPAAFSSSTSSSLAGPSNVSHKVIPTTPFMPTGGDYNSDMMDDDHHQHEEESEDNWPIEEIAVQLKDNGSKGRITSIKRSSRTCMVAMDENGSQTEISYDDIEPVRPGKKDPVRIMLGEHRGELGMLIGVDSHDGIVKLKHGGSGFKILSMNFVGKYTGSENVD